MSVYFQRNVVLLSWITVSWHVNISYYCQRHLLGYSLLNTGYIAFSLLICRNCNWGAQFFAVYVNYETDQWPKEMDTLRCPQLWPLIIILLLYICASYIIDRRRIMLLPHSDSSNYFECHYSLLPSRLSFALHVLCIVVEFWRNKSIEYRFIHLDI